MKTKKLVYLFSFIFAYLLCGLVVLASPPKPRVSLKKSSKKRLRPPLLLTKASTLPFMKYDALLTVGKESVSLQSKKLFIHTKVGSHRSLLVQSLKRVASRVQKTKGKFRGVLGLIVDESISFRLLGPILLAAQKAGFHLYKLGYCSHPPKQGRCRLSSLNVYSFPKYKKIFSHQRRRLNMEIHIISSGYILFDSRNRVPSGCSISEWAKKKGNKKKATIEKGKHQNKALQTCLQNIKELYPDHNIIKIKPAPQTTYKELLHVMFYSTHSSEQKDLFPLIVLLLP